tara:strand:- start:169 stop:510 length:342 start_codon:yes stop_codon:yes gene_type:complete
MSKILNVDKSNGLVVISTEGYLNKDLGEEIQNIAVEYIDNGSNNFLLNLSQSNIVNSIGASIIIELIEKLQEVDGKLSFCELAPIIEKTFNIMGLTKYCKTFNSQAEALEALK